MKTIEERLREYKNANRKERDSMWIMFRDLRGEFDEIERIPEVKPWRYKWRSKSEVGGGAKLRHLVHR